MKSDIHQHPKPTQQIVFIYACVQVHKYLAELESGKLKHTIFDNSKKTNIYFQNLFCTFRISAFLKKIKGTSVFINV